VKRTVLNTVFEPAHEKIDGHAWPEGKSSTLTMVRSEGKSSFCLHDKALISLYLARRWGAGA
jgi:hypothetical protein